MSGYKSLDELEVVLRSGAGIAIICEGHEREDEFFFKEWFAHLARRVTFHAQDGWKRVQEAVTELRRRGTPVPVYGLMDRDFTPDEEIARQADPAFDGHCYRLPRYDLESYLLEPEGWLRVLQKVLFRREERLPEGWDSVDAIAGHIHGYYRAALPLTAHNWTCHRMAQACGSRAGFKGRPYLPSIRALQTVHPEDALGSWARAFGAEEEARESYRDRLSFLEAQAEHIDELQKNVSGKLVLHELHEAIPYARKKPDRMAFAERYLDQRPDPPAELDALIRHILTRAEAERSQ